MLEKVQIEIVGAVVTVLVVLIREYYKNKNKDGEFTKVLPDIHKVYHHLHMLLNTSGASRVTIMKTSNGGGKPKVGALLHSNIVYEMYSKGFRPAKDRWNNEELEQDVVQILCEMLMSDDEYVQKNTDELTQGSLTDLYHADGVNSFRFIKIAEKEKSLIFLTLEYKEKDVNLTASERDAIRFHSGEIKTIFKKSGDV